MSRRTCANRSGSLAGCVAESNRIFCHTTWIRRLRTLTPLYLLYFSFASLSLFFLYYFPSLPPIWSSFHYLDVTPLHYLSCLPLPLPSTHALVLNSLLTTLVLSCSCPLSIPTTSLHLSPLPSHVYKRSLVTKGCVLRHSHREGCWQGPRHYQPKTSKSLGL
jgi:hypothetical protein